MSIIFPKFNNNALLQHEQKTILNEKYIFMIEKTRIIIGLTHTMENVSNSDGKSDSDDNSDDVSDSDSDWDDSYQQLHSQSPVVTVR